MFLKTLQLVTSIPSINYSFIRPTTELDVICNIVWNLRLLIVLNQKIDNLTSRMTRRDPYNFVNSVDHDYTAEKVKSYCHVPNSHVLYDAHRFELKAMTNTQTFFNWLTLSQTRPCFYVSGV